MGLISWFKKEEPLVISELAAWRLKLEANPMANVLATNAYNEIKAALGGSPLAGMILDLVQREFQAGVVASTATAVVVTPLLTAAIPAPSVLATPPAK